MDNKVFIFFTFNLSSCRKTLDIFHSILVSLHNMILIVFNKILCYQPKLCDIASLLKHEENFRKENYFF
jgi:hypothetical protein